MGYRPMPKTRLLSRRRAASSRVAKRSTAAELFSSRIQGHYRCHPQRLCNSSSRSEGPARTGLGWDHHRSNLRCRLQCQWALLRKVDRHAWHDALAVSRGWCQRGHQIRRGKTFLGAILVASTRKGVAAILLGNDPDELQDRFPKVRLIGADRDYEALVALVVGFVEAPKIGLNLPLDVRGTAFQERLWRALQETPAGATASYAEIARRIGAPKSVRAVAGACAANNLAVAIPRPARKVSA